MANSLFVDDESPRNLLLVDDEANILAALKRLLRGSGYQIFTASSGTEGLEILKQHPIGVIVSDQRMPGMSGIEFLSQVKELYPETVRIVLSGYTEFDSITSAINRGAIYRFLTKPWDDDQILAHIAEGFQHHSLKNDNLRLLAINRAMVDTVSDALLLVDSTQGYIVSANKCAKELLGYTEKELLGMPIGEIEMMPQDMFYWEEIANGKFYPVNNVETQYRRADGSWFPVYKSTANAHDGNRGHIVIIARDMTYERHIEQTLEHVNSELKAIFESISDGILVLDMDQRLVRINHRLQSIWDFPQALLQSNNGKSLLQWIGQCTNNPDAWATVLQKILANPKIGGVGRLVMKNGKNINWSCSPQHSGNEVVGLIFSFLDIPAL